jgi:peptidoglycan biosynthesis protein MviN/MurJ (putative lipid II flippase)
VAGFVGLFAFIVAALPPLTLALSAIAFLDRPFLAPILALAWCPVAFGIAQLLFRPAEKIFERRRENLAMLM